MVSDSSLDISMTITHLLKTSFSQTSLFVLCWAFSVSSPCHTYAHIMWFYQHLDVPELRGEWIIMG